MFRALVPVASRDGDRWRQPLRPARLSARPSRRRESAALEDLAERGRVENALGPDRELSAGGGVNPPSEQLHGRIEPRNERDSKEKTERMSQRRAVLSTPRRRFSASPPSFARSPWRNPRARSAPVLRYSMHLLKYSQARATGEHGLEGGKPKRS